MAVYGAVVGCAHLPIWRNWSREPASVILKMLRTLVTVLHDVPFIRPLGEVCFWSWCQKSMSSENWFTLIIQYVDQVPNEYRLFTRTAGKLMATLGVHLRAWWHSFYELASFLDPVYTMPLFSLCFAFFSQPISNLHYLHCDVL